MMVGAHFRGLSRGLEDDIPIDASTWGQQADNMGHFTRYIDSYHGLVPVSYTHLTLPTKA